VMGEAQPNYQLRFFRAWPLGISGGSVTRPQPMPWWPVVVAPQRQTPPGGGPGQREPGGGMPPVERLFFQA